MLVSSQRHYRTNENRNFVFETSYPGSCLTKARPFLFPPKYPHTNYSESAPKGLGSVRAQEGADRTVHWCGEPAPKGAQCPERGIQGGGG
jgi:hypothetical protein